MKSYKIVIRILIILLIFFLGYQSIKYINSNKETNNRIYNVVATINGNTISEMGFSWYSDLELNKSILEIIPENKKFTSEDIIRFVGESKEVSGSDERNKDGKVLAHKAKAIGLKADTKYLYRVGTGEVWSQEGSFTTNSTNGEFTFLHLTDTQGETVNDFKLVGNTFNESIKRFPNSKFITVTGDFVDKGGNEEQWDWFFQSTKDSLLKVPLAPVVGNHEGKSKNFTENFNLEKIDISAKPKGSIYSFQYGNANFIVLNTQMDEEDELEAQINWMRDEVKRNDKKWNIVLMHKGLYTTGSHGTDLNITTNLRPKLTKVFDELEIDLVLQGHDHIYSRTKVIKDGEVSNNGTVYVTANSAGHKFYQPNNEIEDIDLYEVSKQPNKQLYIGVTVSNDELKLQTYLVGSDEIYDEYIIYKTN